MPKSSQPDKKNVKIKKNISLTPVKGHKTQSNNTKRQSNKPNDV